MVRYSKYLKQALQQTLESSVETTKTAVSTLLPVITTLGGILLITYLTLKYTDSPLPAIILSSIYILILLFINELLENVKRLKEEEEFQSSWIDKDS